MATVSTVILITSALLFLAAAALAGHPAGRLGGRGTKPLLGVALLLLAGVPLLLLVEELMGSAPLFHHAGVALALVAASAILVAGIVRRRWTRASPGEQRFRDLVEHTNDLIWEVEVGEEPIFTYVSPRSRDILGYEPEELIGRNPHDLMSEEERTRAVETFEELMATRKPFRNVENVNRHQDGHAVVLETSARPLFDEDGVFRGYRGIDRDITERKEAEEALHRLNRILRVLSAVRQELIHSITTEDHLLNFVCRLIVEEGGYRMAWVGIPRGDAERTVRIMASAGDEQGYLDTLEVRWDDSPLGEGPTGRAIRSGEPIIADDTQRDPEFKPWREAARTSGFRSSVAVPFQSRAAVRGVLCVYSEEPDAFDAEEIRFLQELADDVGYGLASLRMRREKEEVDAVLAHHQRLSELGQITAGIAHDFNNLLTVILTNAQLLEGAVDEEGRADLDELFEASRRGADLVHRMLALSQKKKLTLEPLDLGDLIASLMGTLDHLLPEDLTVRVSCADDLESALILGDAGALEQVVLNLATNARDAMPEGGTLRVELSRVRLEEADCSIHGPVEPGDYVRLNVKDTGTGMPTEVQDHLFDPFFTTKPPGKGTGLGMAITYALVEQHDGFIHVYSEPGTGTSVRVYLPLEPNVVLEAEEVGEDGPGIPTGGHERILVVDDEPAIRRAARRTLQRVGYAVEVAEDGREALGLLRGDGAFDLVVTDLRMPSMGGDGLYRNSRKEGITVPFLLTSGYANHTGEGTSEEAKSLREVPFLEKPWTVSQLLARVREVLNGESDEGSTAG